MDGPAQPSQVQRLEQRVLQLEREIADLTAARQRSDQDLAQLRAVIDHAPLAIYLKDASFQYLLVNREYERLSAVGRAQVVGRDDFALFADPVARLFRAQDQEVIAKRGPAEFKETVPLPDGVHTFITSKFPLWSEAGELRGVAGVCTEITELEQARARLEEAQAELLRQARLATLGELAAVIAHEVRNPLGAVFNALATLQRNPGCGTGTARELLDIIKAEADRLNRMVGALLELGRPPPPCFAPVVVTALAAGAIEVARSLTDASAEVRLVVPQPLPEARLDGHLVHQALSNLVCNALQAPQRRGPVTVRVDLVAQDLRFAVIDDGVGVPPELAEQIFTPFFTTRAAGTGLGLAVVRSVAQAHQGSVTLEQTPGGGATFVLQLPFTPVDGPESP